MHHTNFQIEHDDFLIQYNPLPGRIQQLGGDGVVAPESKVPHIISQRAGFAEDMKSRFRPHCLTIYMNHTCNLRCDYCYAQTRPSIPTGDVSLAAVRAAAELVGASCAEFRSPFVLGFHGGNEPLLNRPLIESIMGCCREVADTYRLPLMSFCTTNGVVDQETAEWAARTFQGLTLSWDGYQEIHDMHRRRVDNRPTFDIVRRTAEIFKTLAPQRLTLRLTITNHSVSRLSEIARFFSENGFHNVQVFPVYLVRNGGPDKNLAVDQAEFVFNFLNARTWANSRTMNLMFSGTRQGEIHGQFCTWDQNNLTMTPDGFVTACFLATHNHENENHRYVFGRFDEASKELHFDWKKLQSMFDSMRRGHLQCEDCFNQYHCSRNCPDLCPLQESDHDSEFDCSILKWIALADIIEKTGTAVAFDTREECINYFKSIRITNVTPEECHERIPDYN